MIKFKKFVSIFIFISLLTVPVFAFANTDGVFDSVIKEFDAEMKGWEAIFLNAAKFIFFVLSSISIVMTGFSLIFKREDIGGFFAEYIRLILFLGFFYWLLTNGAKMSTDIINGIKQLAGNAGKTATLSPSAIADIGFDIFGKVLKKVSAWAPIDSAVMIIVGLIILVVICLIAVNMLLMIITAWFMTYAGIFILGFGGGRWTSDMAINYFKQVLNLALQLCAMILIISIGQNTLNQSLAQVGSAEYVDLAIILVKAIIILALAAKIPPLLGSLAGGAGNGGIGQLGTGNAISAAAMFAGAAAGAGAALKSLAVEAGGLKKAFEAAKAGLGGSNGSSDSGSGKMGSAVDAVGGANAGDKSNQDGKPLTAESSGNSGNGSEGSTTGNSRGNPSGSSEENTISSGNSASSGEATSTNTSASSGAEGSTEGGSASSETSQSASDSPSSNSERAPQTAGTTPKTTNTGGGSPLATAMGGNKVSNWQAAKNVAVGLVSSRWNNAVNNSAGGRLVKHWENENKETDDPTKNPQKDPEGANNA